ATHPLAVPDLVAQHAAQQWFTTRGNPLQLQYVRRRAAPRSASIASGDNQAAPPNSWFFPLAALVVDEYGHPVAGATVAFTLPASGASATFQGGGLTSTAV